MPSPSSSSTSRSSSFTTTTTSIPWIALWSGTCGAIASSLAKLAFANNTTSPSSTDDAVVLLIFHSWSDLLFRAVCLISMIGCNVFAVGAFVQGMEESGSVPGTALTTAANCVVSAILGVLVWGDDPPDISVWIGILMVLLGIGILVMPSREPIASSDKDDKKMD